MQNTYAQKQKTAQKKDAPTAAAVLDSSSQSEGLQRKADMANNAAQCEETPRPNNTRMPDNLKSGIESLSGFSMDDVRVHYNSSKPATVQALAYTQGTDIHVAPGQEKHLPHEAWHVAQQMAGRVSPTTNINGMPVNDNAGLEHEADVMGEKAKKSFPISQLRRTRISKNAFQLKIDPDELNVIGEYHPESEGKRDIEKKFLCDKTGSSNYETEATFKTINEEFGDPPILRFPQGILFHEKSMNALFEEFGKMPSENAQTYYTLATNYLRSAEIDLDNIPKDSIFTDKINASKKICCKLRAIPRIILQAIITKNSNLFDNEKKDWIEHINEIKSYFQFENISIEQQAKRRSFAMHWAAVAASKHGKRGTWKIGNDHCNDILTHYGNPIDYNLTTRDEFYQALSTYPPNKPQPPLPPQAPVRPTNTDEKKGVP